jgi:hypothetical protein
MTKLPAVIKQATAMLKNLDFRDDSTGRTLELKRDCPIYTPESDNKAERLSFLYPVNDS